MNRSIVLDFDGVLFDSAYEAYCVCQHLSSLRVFVGMRENVSYVEFSNFRPQVRNAADFIDLYFDSRPDEALFLEAFFKSRVELSSCSSYAEKYFPPYDFFTSISDLLRSRSEAFYILSTRDADSIRSALGVHNVNLGNHIIGQSQIKKFGTKIAALRAFGLDTIDLYIDDMAHYAIELKPVSKLSLQAGWGYGHTNSYCIDQLTGASLIRLLMEV